ncbi:hypothetical protein V6U90_18490 [Micromonospora sp. CPCC 206060]|uniref:hypothetical protein n=1 Tax=Micromonospora sp. CPCC 206060 TaxID=3122406 RepID=UPI002FF1799B
MTDPHQPADDRDTARQAAAAHTAASRDIEAFLRRVPAVPGTDDIAEYATLLAREEQVRAERQAMVDAMGLPIGSVGTE